MSRRTQTKKTDEETPLEFKSYEGMLEDIANKHVNNALKKGNIEKKDWINDVTHNIIKEIHDNKIGLKFLVNGFIRDKGFSNLHFVTGNLWIKETDGIIKIPIDTEKKEGFIILYVISP